LASAKAKSRKSGISAKGMRERRYLAVSSPSTERMGCRRSRDRCAFRRKDTRP
jgi:hypothetical protein